MKPAQYLKLIVVLSVSFFALGAEASNTPHNLNSSPHLALKGEHAYFDINGRVVFDYSIWDNEAFSGVAGEGGSGSEIRRARISLKGGYKDWHFKLQTDFSGNKTSNKNSYIMYSGFENMAVTFGNHKEPFGLENLSSSKHISAIERAATTGSFAGGRYVGVSVAGSGERFGYRVGVFDIGSSEVKASYSVTGRLTYALVNQKNRVVHLGAGASLRQMNEDRVFAIASRAGIHSTSIKSIVSKPIQPSYGQVGNLEFSLQANKLNLTAEALVAKYDQTSTSPAAQYSTSYLQLGYFLTEDRRKYKVSTGNFGSVKPSSKKGAWEIYTRFEDLDLQDNLAGTQGTILTMGLNWFATRYTRLSANYVVSQLSIMQADLNISEIEGNALSVRAQFFW